MTQQQTATTLLNQAHERDSIDDITATRAALELPTGIYLDGNSLGPTAKAAKDSLEQTLEQWAQHGVGAWPDWLAHSRQTADLLARTVLDVDASEVALSDSTSVNLFKLISAVIDAAASDRTVVVIDPNDFPTNRYLVDGIAKTHNLTIRPLVSGINDGIDTEQVATVVDTDVAAVVVSHVNYRSGARVDMKLLTDAARAAGTYIIWDLSHSAGIYRPHLDPDISLAVGCTYKYLSGGPGCPGFIYVPTALHVRLQQPLWGWFAHEDQFGMHETFTPAETIDRFLVGTPPMLSTAPLHAALELIDRAGLDTLKARADALSETVRTATKELLSPLGFKLASPNDVGRTGAHLSMRHDAAWQVCQAAREEGIVVDYREPGRIRLGPSPLYTRHTELVEACVALAKITESGAYRKYPTERSGVT